jgi:hypothetical protein
MTIEQLFSETLTFVYSEVDDETATFCLSYAQAKLWVKEFNRAFDTKYQTINEFNDGENYRKIEIQL